MAMTDRLQRQDQEQVFLGAFNAAFENLEVLPSVFEWLLSSCFMTEEMFVSTSDVTRMQFVLHYCVWVWYARAMRFRDVVGK